MGHRGHLSTLILAVVVGAPVTPDAAAQAPSPAPRTTYDHVIAYDVRNARIERCAHFALRDAQCSPEPRFHYGSDDSLVFLVRNARCSSDYRIDINEKGVAETPSVRGLEAAAELTAGAAGVRQLGPKADDAVVTLEPLTTIMAQLTTTSGIAGLELEIQDELHRLGVAEKDLATAFTDHRDAVCRAVGPIAGCPPPTGPSLRATLASAADALSRDIDGASADGCEGIDKAVQDVGDWLIRVRRLRESIGQPPIGSFGDDLASQAETLDKRLTALLLKLDRATSAADMAEAALRLPFPPLEPLLGEFKRLKELYGELLTTDDLRRIQETFNAQHRQDPKGIVANLNRFRSEVKDTFRPSATTLRQRVAETKTSLRLLRKAFEASIIQFNEALHSLVDRAQARYDQTRGDRFLAQAGPWPQSQVLTVRFLEAQRANRLPVEVSTAASVGVSSATPSATPPTAPPAELPPPVFRQVAADAIPVHKTYRFSIGAGLFVSALGTDEFAVRSLTRVDATGAAVLNAEGAEIKDKKLVKIGADDNTVGYMVSFIWYPRPIDVFPGAARPTWGLMTGFSLNHTLDDLFGGLVFQPYTGVQLMAGVNLGRRPEPQAEVTPSITVLNPDTVDAPTRKGWRKGTFVSIGFDVNIFRALFGTGK